MINTLGKYSRFFYVIGLLLGGALFLMQLGNVVAAMIKSPPALRHPWLLCVSVAAALLATFFQVGGWRALMRSLGVRLGWGQSLVGYAIPFIARYIPGTIWGYLGRAHLLKRRYGIAHTLTHLSAITEAAGFVAAASFVATCMGALAGDVLLSLLGVAGCGLVAIGLMIVRLVSRQDTPFDPFLTRIGGKSWLEGVTAKRVLLAAAWHSGLWIGFGLVMWAILGMLTEVQLTAIPAAVAVYGLAWVAGFLVIFVPAGLGLREYVLTYLLVRSFDLPTELAITIAMLMRAHLIVVELLTIFLALVVERSPGFLRDGSEEAEPGGSPH